MNTLIQDRHNHNENWFTVEVSPRTQKVEIYLANEGSGLAFFSTDLEHNLASKVGIEFGVTLREKATDKNLEFVQDIVSSLSWHTQTWLSTKMLATKKPHCCVAFFLFQSSKLETL